MDPVQGDATNRVNNALAHLRSELSSIRAGRANPSLIENIPVEAYGATMKLMEVGTIAAPQPTLLTIQVWDAGLAQNVVKAIQEANLGLNPANDGQLIRLPIPPLTEERREEFIKLAHQKMEQCRIEIRQIRQDIKEQLEQQQEKGEFGEDELDRKVRTLQDLMDKAQSSIEEFGKQKEAELREI